jgi:small GTP-binding protein
MSEVFSFAARESQEAFRLYFEPLHWLLRIFGAGLKPKKRDTASYYLERAIALRQWNAVKPGADHLTVTVFGFIGAGKSTLINTLMGVNDWPRRGGARNLRGEAAVRYEWQTDITIIDTPGIGSLPSEQERAVSQRLIQETDFILLVLDAASQFNEGDLSRAYQFLRAGKPVLVLLNRADLVPEHEVVSRLNAIEDETGLAPVPFSNRTGLNVQAVRELLLLLSRGSNPRGFG